jgi:hypothetical protein
MIDDKASSNVKPFEGARSRPTGDRPWCWQEKAVIRQIRDAWDSKTYLDQALATYLVLTEKASDKQSATFDVSKREIASKSGVSLRRVTTILNELRALGVLHWTNNREPESKELLPNTYTVMLGTANATRGTRDTRLCKRDESHNCAVIEESVEKSQKKQTQSSGDDWRQSYSEEELEIIDLL